MGHYDDLRDQDREEQAEKELIFIDNNLKKEIGGLSLGDKRFLLEMVRQLPDLKAMFRIISKQIKQ